MNTGKKGKILKIKKGYNPNCSSSMWYLGYFFARFLLGFLVVGVSIALGKIIHNIHIRKEEDMYIKRLKRESKYESEV